MVYIEYKGQFKTDKFCLGERMLIEELEMWNDKEICKSTVQQNGVALQYVKEQTEEICKLTVQQIGMAIQYVKEQTEEEICILEVDQNGLALNFVRK